MTCSVLPEPHKGTRTRSALSAIPGTLLVAVGAGWVYLATGSAGIGVTPDSVTYISVAENLMRGSGMFDFYARPVTEFPPGYPVLLAIVARLTTVSPHEAARLVSAVSLGLTVLVVWNVVARLTRCAPLALVASLLTVAGRPHSIVHAMAWSEPATITLTAVALGALGQVLARDRAGEGVPVAYVALATLACGAACLMRYASVVLVISGVLAMLLGLRPGRPRILVLLVFAITSLLPVSLWCLRNFLTDGTAMGGRMASTIPYQESVTDAAATLGAWLIPTDLHAGPRRSLVLGLVAVILLSLTHRRIHMAHGRSATHVLGLPPLAFVSAIYVLLYLAFVVATASMVAYGRPDDKYLAPVLVGIIFYACATMGSVRSSPVWGPRSAFVMGCAVAALGIASVGHLLSVTREYRASGPPGLAYCTEHKKELLRVAVMVAGDPDSVMMTNDPYGLWWHTRIVARSAPRARYRAETTHEVPQTERYREVDTLLEQGRRVFLVWFAQSDYFVRPEHWSREVADLRGITENSGGGVYELVRTRRDRSAAPRASLGRTGFPRRTRCGQACLVSRSNVPTPIGQGM